jgi:hypothetical protein
MLKPTKRYKFKSSARRDLLWEIQYSFAVEVARYKEWARLRNTPIPDFMDRADAFEDLLPVKKLCKRNRVREGILCDVMFSEVAPPRYGRKPIHSLGYIRPKPTLEQLDQDESLWGCTLAYDY